MGPASDGPHGPERRRLLRRHATVKVSVERLDQLGRLVGKAATAHLRVGRLLDERLGVEAGSVPEFHDLSHLLGELQEKTMQACMVPFATIVEPCGAPPGTLRGCSARRSPEVRGEDTELDRRVLEQLNDPLLHLVRNAVDHGIEPPAAARSAGKPPPVACGCMPCSSARTRS